MIRRLVFKRGKILSAGRLNKISGYRDVVIGWTAFGGLFG